MITSHLAMHSKKTYSKKKPLQSSSKTFVNMNQNGHCQEHNTVQSFLQAHTVKHKNEIVTHTAMSGGKYNIPFELRDEFHNLLAKACFKDKQSISLVERHVDFAPILVDLDIEYKTDTSEQHNRIYTEDTLKNFLSTFIYFVEYCCDLGEDDRKTRLVYIFEKSEPTQKSIDEDGKTIWKDGLHIVLPNVITSPEVQKLIRRLVLTEFDDIIQDFEENGYKVINRKEDIYDECVIQRNGWMMYGCNKPNKPSYVFTQMWHGKTDVLHKYTSSEMGCYPEINQEEITLHMGHHTLYKGSTSGASLFVDRLSISSRNNKPFVEEDCVPSTPNCKMELQKIEDLQKKHFQKKKHSNPWMTRCETQDDLEFVTDLIDCLSDERATPYMDWIKVGWALHNIHNDPDNDVLKHAYIDFSKQSSKHTDDEVELSCEKMWNECRQQDDDRQKIQLGSLCHWAKTDNPELYKKAQSNYLKALMRECCNKFIPNVESETDAKGNVKEGKLKTKAWDDVCYYLVEVLYKKYKTEYVCSTYGKKIWWEYKNHRWTDATIGLLNVLSDDVNELFEEFASEFHMKLQNCSQDDKNRREYERMRKAARGIAEHTRNTNSKKQILTESAEKFYWSRRAEDKLHNTQFEVLLDQNQYLIGLENGVYDLKEHCFREGCSEDYISRCTGNAWHEPEEGWSDPCVKAILSFFAQVLPYKSIRDYVLTLFASFCDGKIQEKFHIFVGCGGNGKSKLIDLFLNAMGQSGDGKGYCGNLPVSALTGKRANSGAASPEFERLKGMRFVVVQEPDQQETMQVGRLKELTGGDTIQARGLHKEPIEFKPQFGMVMASNVLPTVPGDDGGVWRRMRVVRFNSKFKDQPDPNDPTEFPIDLDLSTKLQDWKQTFFWILMQYYRVFREGDNGVEPILHYEEGESRAPKGLRKCLFVDEETERYRNRNDKFNTFIQLNVNPNPPNAIKAYLNMDILWQRYMVWCKEQNIRADMNELQDAMQLRYDIMYEINGFRGWKKIALWTDAEMQQKIEKNATEMTDIKEL